MPRTQQQGGFRLHYSYSEKTGTTGVAFGPVDHEDEYKNAYDVKAALVTELLSKKFTLAASGTLTIDLQNETDDDNIVRAFDKVYTWYLEIHTKGGKVYLSPGAANGWSGLVREDSDAANDTVPQKVLYYGAQGGDAPDGIAVSSSAKTVLFTNASSSAEVEVTVHFAGAKKAA